MLKPLANPLLAGDEVPEGEDCDTDTDGLAFDCKKLKTPYSTRGQVATSREIRKALRQQTAAEAVGELYPGCAIFGITKGQFSLIELISTVLDQTGPAEVFLSTWTAAGSDLTEAHQLLESGKMLSFRCLVDLPNQHIPAYFSCRGKSVTWSLVCGVFVTCEPRHFHRSHQTLTLHSRKQPLSWPQGGLS